MQSGRIPADIQHVHQVLDDLPECERHDREIVSVQTQHGDTDQETEDARHNPSDQDCEQKTGKSTHGLFKYFTEKCARKSPDAHKTGMTQR